MKSSTFALALVLLCAGGLMAQGQAQAPGAAQAPQTIMERGAIAPIHPPGFRNYNAVYCSGFIADRELQEGLFVVSSEDGGLAMEYVPGSVVYLSRGAGWVVRPSGEYQVLRRMVDINRREIFPGQHQLVRELGTVYAEVGRLNIRLVHENVAIAEVTHACDSIRDGDVAIPFDVKHVPPILPSGAFDRFAPPSGRGDGRVAAAKEFGMILREGDIAYLDIGGREGVQVGQYYRAYRPFKGHFLDFDRRYRHQIPEFIGGQRVGFNLTPRESRMLPRDVLGEFMIVHVEGRSATAVVTFAQRDILVGDFVELQ
jgi:hypothetical protein